MDAASMRPRAAFYQQAGEVDWAAVATWLLCFGLVAYLGLKGGGYDPLVHDQVGVAVWWVLLAGVLVGALPRRRPPALAWTALGLLAAFVLWTALSLTWTESVERTAADLARVTTYLGVFCLALSTRSGGSSQRLVSAVGAGIALVAFVALLSRLHPAWFPEADQTGRFLEDRERLSYPLNYWNGLAGLIAIGMPLLLQLASCARGLLYRASAAAALPALMLTLYLTLSRGGIAATVVAVAVFLCFASDRLPKLLTLLLAGAGGSILVVAANQRDSLQHGLTTATAHNQGNELLAIAIVVCLAVGALQACGTFALRRLPRPRWTLPTRRQTAVAAVAALAVVLVAALAAGAPGRVSNGWDEFKEGGGPGEGTGRLGSVAGQSRYQFWSAAAKENASEPLTGTGSGTFEYWWARNGDTTETVRDTHSLYMQTLGELGIVGLALLAAFLLTVLAGGAREALRGGALARPPLAAALAGCAAFCITAIFDWMWQIPALTVSLLLLGAALVTGARRTRAEPGALALPFRLGFAAAALAAIVAIAIPLSSTSLLRQSEADARDGDLPAALEAARSAQNAEPGAATPRLQQALVLESQGDLDAAAAAAGAATERESTNWRTWLVLSRIEAERGRAAAAVAAYREARSLNPRSQLFER
jgi:O-antigen ligase/polysaccharide polymerase Wzy-like membrane protein